MKTSTCILAVCTGMLLGPLTTHAQESWYEADTENTDYSGLGPNGGTIIVPMVLYPGDPEVPGIGTSFNLTVTVSAITPYYAPAGTYTWNNTPPVGVTYPGPLYPDNVYTDLPAQNVTSLPAVVNGVDYADDFFGWWDEVMNEGLLVYLGEFTITVGNYPPPPPGYEMRMASTIIGWQPGGVLSGGDGILGKGYLTFFETIYSDYDVTLNVRFTAFAESDFSEPIGQFWSMLPFVTYQVVPEAGTPMLLLLGMAALLGKRRIKRN